MRSFYGNPNSDAARSLGMSVLQYGNMMNTARANDPQTAQNKAAAEQTNQQIQAEAAANEQRRAAEEERQREAERQRVEQERIKAEQDARAQVEAKQFEDRGKASALAGARTGSRRGAGAFDRQLGQAASNLSRGGDRGVRGRGRTESSSQSGFRFS